MKRYALVLEAGKHKILPFDPNKDVPELLISKDGSISGSYPTEKEARSAKDIAKVKNMTSFY